MRITLQQDKKGRYYQLTDEGLKSTPETLVCTTVVPIDMTDADIFRKKFGEENKTHISLTSLILKATANALEDFPMLCGFWESEDKVRCPTPGEITLFGSVRVENTLGSFTLERASRKSLLELSKEFTSQVNNARSKRRAWKPPSPPCFITTNVGTLGPVESFDMSGISLKPNIAGMGTGAVLEKPSVKDGQIQIRKIMNSILFWNHRAMNADIPIEFQTRLKRNLEEPSTYLV